MRHALAVVGTTLVLAVAVTGQTWRWLPEPRGDRPNATVYDARHDRTLFVRSTLTETARLYEWDGTTLREVLPAPSFLDTPMWLGVDPLDGRILLLGLTGQAARFGTWDGSSWWFQNITPAIRLDHETRFAYDEQRRKLVCYRPDTVTSRTAEFDGFHWTYQLGGVPLRYSPGFAYDPVGARCLLYGGSSQQGALADCWSWDGTSWTQLTANAAPGPRMDPGMAFAPTLGGLLLYGNENGSTTTWLLTGNSWQQLPTPHHPGWQRLPHLVRDPVGDMLLVQGRFGDAGQAWRFAGGDWTAVDGLDGPNNRTIAAVAFDQVRRQTVLHGGTDDAARSTMVYDTTWHRVAPAQNPPLRGGPHLAWSQLDQAVLLFGGRDLQNVLLGDTWSWNGIDWVPRTPPTAPSPRVGAVLCPEPAGSVMLFSGGDGVTAFNDQWRWNGTTWTQLLPTSMPPSQLGARAALDPARGRVVMAGLRSPGVPGTWEWDGAAWTTLQPTVQPGVNGSGAIGFDPQRGRVVLLAGSSLFEWSGANWIQLAYDPRHLSIPFGFVTDTGHGRLLVVDRPEGAQVMRLGLVAPTVTVTGGGCAVALPPSLVVAGEPHLGRADSAFELRDAPPLAATVVAVGLRSIQQPIGACTLRVDAVVDWLFGFADASGDARRAVAIPMDPALRDLTLFAQGFAYDPANSPIGAVTFTSALAVTIGD